MDRSVMRDVFALYKDEFDADSFINNGEESLLQLLLIYKHKLNIDFSYNGCPLYFDKCSEPNTVITAENVLQVGGAHYDDEYFEELVSGFINHNIGATDDDEKYAIYIDPTLRKTQLAKVNKDATAGHIYGYGTRQMFMSLITKLLPWYFDDLSDAQMDLVREIATMIISENGLNAIQQTFEEVMNEIGAPMAVQREKLERMGEQLMEKRSENVRYTLNDKQQRYEDAYNRVMQLNAEIRELKIQLMAIENSQDEFENPIHEIIDFLEHTKYDYKLDHVTDECVYLAYKAPLQVYSNDSDYEKYVKNSATSTFIKRFNSIASVDDIRAAYKRIMEDKDCLVWTSGVIQLNMYTYRPRVTEDVIQPGTERHPHLNKDISCFGTAEEMIMNYLKAGRLSEAMNAIAYATKQLTLYDSYAVRYFIDGIERIQCIECPDGKMRTFGELIEAIKKEEI